MLKTSPHRLRLEVFGTAEFAAHAAESTAALPNVEIVRGGTGPDVRLVDPRFVGRAQPSESGIAVVAGWLVAWGDADESAAVSRADVVAAAVMLAHPGTSGQVGPSLK
jgi:hypothetical protein